MAIVIIETPRVNMGLLTPEEYPLMQRYLHLNKTHLAPWEPERDRTYATQYEIILRIKNSLLAFKQQSAFHFVILSKDNNEVIGVCNFANLVRGAMQGCTLGYAISASHQGQGLMKEALIASINYIFTKVKLHRIMANYIPANKRSENLLMSLGFQKEGYANAYLSIAGQWQDHILTALINPADDK
jgi:ribosomal-protein-alanine N-acetyltransferase